MRGRMSVRRAAARLRFVVPAAFVALALGACGDDDPSDPGADEVAEWFENVSAGLGAEVSIVDASAPEESGGPGVAASLLASFISGGTTQLDVSSFEQFDGLVLALEGVRGHVAVDFGSDRSDATISITLQGDLPSGIFELRVAGRQGSQVGDYVTIPVSVVQVGTGDVQVSVSWDAPSDVDLYVVEPGGEEIFYGNPFSASGGMLDLDSNAGCSIDNVNNENITWGEDASPPSGQYTVRVNYWDSCGVSATNYVVTVRLEGQDTRTYTGSLTGAGVGGAEGAGSVVATFTR